VPDTFLELKNKWPSEEVEGNVEELAIGKVLETNMGKYLSS
jgi:hypothetical protein